jgi:hypothetical protein
MKKLTAVLTLLLMSAATSATAAANQAISTEELVRVCEERPGSEQHTYCDAYGQGVYDTYLVTRHPKQAPSFICVVQPAPSRSEVMDRFIEWVKLNPVHHKAPAADSLLRFLSIRFPCETPAMAPDTPANKVRR